MFLSSVMLHLYKLIARCGGSRIGGEAKEVQQIRLSRDLGRFFSKTDSH